MNCTACDLKSCRGGKACGAEGGAEEEIVDRYREKDSQAILQSAARLVDGGRAGSLSRLQELELFIKDRGYSKVALAYCYGMEKEALAVMEHMGKQGIRASAVSCTVGAIAQNKINAASSLCGVSCNPLGQAAQLEREGTDLAVLFGLCLGHDILFARSFRGDQTVLAVKDRLFGQARVL